MRDGRLIQEGTPRELMRNPADAFVEQLVGTPKRQARRVEELLGTGGAV
jgi:osmoprotectant transport system ATP-binding protein